MNRRDQCIKLRAAGLTFLQIGKLLGISKKQARWYTQEAKKKQRRTVVLEFQGERHCMHTID